jgi:haloalkane dehalogenase
MDVLRTPDDRFANLPDFAFAPRWVEIPSGDGGTLRVHHLDEGPADGPVVVLLHGEPSWCFLYRHMMPVLTQAGFRCVAPDLPGFGRSDKPARREDYSYAAHVAWLRATLFDALALRDVTLVCQDWGGLLGLRLVGEHPDRFARVVAANTFLPTGDDPVPEGFHRWRAFSQRVDPFPAGFVVSTGCTTTLAPAVVAAYDAPFPDETYKAGARQFPVLVPITPDDPASEANRRAWASLRRFTKPFLCAFSDGDPVTAGGDAVFRREVPGTQGQPHVTIRGGGHFLQEDRGPELARVVVEFARATGA